MTTTGRREAKKAQKRADLLAAALQLFLEEGYQGASIERIAAAADVARGTFYLYFADKESIFQDVIDDLLDPVMDALEACRDRLEISTCVEETQHEYEALRGTLVGILIEHAPTALLYFREQRGAGRMGDWLRERQERIDSFVTDMIRSLIRRQLLRECEPVVVARSIIGAIERLTFDFLSGRGAGDPLTVGAEVERFFAVGVLTGIGIETRQPQQMSVEEP